MTLPDFGRLRDMLRRLVPDRPGESVLLDRRWGEVIGGTSTSVIAFEGICVDRSMRSRKGRPCGMELVCGEGLPAHARTANQADTAPRNKRSSPSRSGSIEGYEMRLNPRTPPLSHPCGIMPTHNPNKATHQRIKALRFGSSNLEIKPLIKPMPVAIVSTSTSGTMPRLNTYTATKPNPAAAAIVLVTSMPSNKEG